MEQKISAAFSSKSTVIKKQLINEVKIISGENSINTIGLWDTGATGSCISHDVAEKLKLVPTGKMTIQTPSGKTDVNTHSVNIILPNNVTVSNVVVCDTMIGEQGIGLLIGMDIISLGDFAVTNYNGKTSVTFRLPSIKEIDFVREAQIQALIGPKHGKGKRKKK